MKKIILISHEPLTQRQASIYCIKKLRENGFDYQYWDASSIFHSDLKLPDQSEDSIKLSTFQQFKDLLDQTDITHTLFVIDVFLTWRKRYFFKYLKLKGCYTIHINFYSNSDFFDPPLFRTFWNSSWNIKYDKVRLWGGNMLNYLYQFFYSYKPYDLYISSGKNGNPDRYINNPDFESYKIDRHVGRIINEPYILFIDQYFPLHPDLTYLNENMKEEAISYQNSLNRFFSICEREYKMPVVVAAHPKSLYDDQTFNGRKIIKYQTTLLIKDAAFIVLHYSSSIAAIILFNKPFLIITTNECEKSNRYRACIRQLAKRCRKNAININNCKEASQIDVVSIEENVRSRYIEQYITLPMTENMSNTELLSGIFKEIN